jgi:hypothetical protein
MRQIIAKKYPWINEVYCWPHRMDRVLSCFLNFPWVKEALENCHKIINLFSVGSSYAALSLFEKIQAELHITRHLAKGAATRQWSGIGNQYFSKLDCIGKTPSRLPDSKRTKKRWRR